MFQSDIVKFALTNYSGILLILTIAYFLARDNFDKRYIRKSNFPTKECYDIFVTKEMQDEKDSQFDKTVASIHLEIKNMRSDIDKKIDILIDLFNRRK